MIIPNSFYLLYYRKEDKLWVMFRISVLLWSVNVGIVTRYKPVSSGFYTVFQYLQVFKPIIHFVYRGFGMSFLPPYISRGEIVLGYEIPNMKILYVLYIYSPQQYKTDCESRG